IAKVSFIHPTILAHRVLGSFYLILHNALIYNIACILFEEENKKYYRGIFASLVSLLTIWDFHSYLTDSTFVLTRTWQGKAMFCAFAVPMAVLLLLLIGKSEGKKNIYFILTAVLCVASVLMTPAAIYMLSLFLVSGVIAITFSTKKFAVCLKTVPALIPMAGFLAVYIIYIH
ncbi:MAG: hypothetical protein K5776_07705, partial [Lachnospiraceae bacterium]|nr:hypothetical protein [Lachnospiraceae bacterium]